MVSSRAMSRAGEAASKELPVSLSFEPQCLSIIHGENLKIKMQKMHE